MNQSTNPTHLTMPVEPIDHAIGEGRVTVVWYGDYECPDCAHAWPILKELVETSPAVIRLVYRHFPMSSVHPHASVAAQAAEAAAAQKKFWELHDTMYQHQHDLHENDFTHLAMRAGLEIYKFNADLSSERFSKRVQRDIDSGTASGVKGTPTLFLDGVRFGGVMSLESLRSAISG